MEKYLNFEKKIDKLIKKRNKIHFLNENSTTAMLDMHGIRACEKAEARARKHNLKARERLKEYDEIIAEILLLMINSGYSIDNILNKYDMSEILNKNLELSSYLNDRTHKR